MLTDEQKKWVARLPNDDVVAVVGYDSACVKIFEAFKHFVEASLCGKFLVEHHGASSLKISGQDEIDVYIVIEDDFVGFLESMEALFGTVKSVTLGRRARFGVSFQGKKIDLFLVQKNHPEWAEHMKIKKALLESKPLLMEYERLKQSVSGKSTQEYYRVKLEFLNAVLKRK